MNKDIEQAIQNFRANNWRYAKTERYYAGNHDLAFATEKFQNAFGNLFREFALNLCPAIVDAVKDKLIVTGFSVDELGARASSPPVANPSKRGLRERNAADRRAGSPRSDCRRIWQQNRMGAVAGEIHKEVLKNGDAYAIVWPNARGEATIYPNKAAKCSVIYDDETPGRILWAAKY